MTEYTYTGVVAYYKGANTRPDPHTWNIAQGTLPYLCRIEFDYIKRVSDVEEWALLPDGLWVALKYPGSQVMRIDYWETGSLVWPENLYRCLHDFETPPYYTARVNLPTWGGKRTGQTPEVYPLHQTPRMNSAGGRVKLIAHEAYLKQLNPTRNKWNYLTSTNSGWFNKTGWPQWEMLAMGGNWFNVLDEKDGYYRVETLRADYAPNIERVNPIRTPWLIQRFTVVTADNRAIDPPPGLVFCTLATAYGDEAWIDKDRLVKI